MFVFVCCLVFPHCVSRGVWAQRSLRFVRINASGAGLLLFSSPMNPTQHVLPISSCYGFYCRVPGREILQSHKRKNFFFVNLCIQLSARAFCLPPLSLTLDLICSHIWNSSLGTFFPPSFLLKHFTYSLGDL